MSMDCITQTLCPVPVLRHVITTCLSSSLCVVLKASIVNLRRQGSMMKKHTALQMTMSQLGDIRGPITGPMPTNVTGELDLTQGFGPLDNGTALTRGYVTVPSSTPYFSTAGQVGLQEQLSIGCVKTIADPGRDFHCALSVLGSYHYGQKDTGFWPTGE